MATPEALENTNVPKPKRTTLAPSTTRPTLSQFFIFAVLVLGCAAVGERLSLFLHEVVGHGLTASLLGADVELVAVRPLGGGWARYRYPAGTPAYAQFLSTSAGIAVDVFASAAALVAARWLRRWPIAVLFSSLFALRAMIAAMGYLVMGLYYRTGDPGRILRMMGVEEPPWLSVGPWLAVLLLTPFAAFAIGRLYLLAQEHWLPSPEGAWWKVCGIRLLRAGLSVGVAFAILGSGGKIINAKPTVAFEAAGKRQAAAHARKLWLQAEAKRYREANPEATNDEVDAHLRGLLAAKAAPRPADAPQPFPMRPIFIGLIVLGSLIAVIRPPPRLLEGRSLTIAHALTALTVAVLLISLLAWKPVWWV